MKRAWVKSAAIGMLTESCLLVVVGFVLDIRRFARRGLPADAFDRVVFSMWFLVTVAAVLPVLNSVRRKWPAFWGNVAGIVLVLLCIVLLLWFVSIVAPH